MRYLRGRIVAQLCSLPPGQAVSPMVLFGDLQAHLPHHGAADVERALVRLSGEGLLAQDESGFRLA